MTSTTKTAKVTTEFSKRLEKTVKKKKTKNSHLFTFTQQHYQLKQLVILNCVAQKKLNNLSRTIHQG